MQHFPDIKASTRHDASVTLLGLEPTVSGEIAGYFSNAACEAGLSESDYLARVLAFIARFRIAL